MLRFEDAVKEQEERFQKERAFLEKHKPLFRTAMEYGCMFSKNHDDSYPHIKRASSITFACGGITIDAVALDLYLGEDDSIIKDVGPIIEDLKEHPQLKFLEDTEYLEMGWKGWDFRRRDNGARLLVRAWFEQSTKCKKVGTGKFKEVMEVICEE